MNNNRTDTKTRHYFFLHFKKKTLYLQLITKTLLLWLKHVI